MLIWPHIPHTSPYSSTQMFFWGSLQPLHLQLPDQPQVTLRNCWICWPCASWGAREWKVVLLGVGCQPWHLTFLYLAIHKFKAVTVRHALKFWDIKVPSNREHCVRQKSLNSYLLSIFYTPGARQSRTVAGEKPGEPSSSIHAGARDWRTYWTAICYYGTTWVRWGAPPSSHFLICKNRFQHTHGKVIVRTNWYKAWCQVAQSDYNIVKLGFPLNKETAPMLQKWRWQQYLRRCW